MPWCASQPVRNRKERNIGDLILLSRLIQVTNLLKQPGKMIICGSSWNPWKMSISPKPKFSRNRLASASWKVPLLSLREDRKSSAIFPTLVGIFINIENKYLLNIIVTMSLYFKYVAFYYEKTLIIPFTASLQYFAYLM